MAIALGLISFHLHAGLPLKKLRLVLQTPLLLFSLESKILGSAFLFIAYLPQRQKTSTPDSIMEFTLITFLLALLWFTPGHAEVIYPESDESWLTLKHIISCIV